MSPEDLEEFRKAARLCRANSTSVSQLFADILDAAIAHIDTQAAQISLLKEKLVESQAAINSLSLPLGMDPIDLGIDWSEGELEAARQQLKAEMPEVGLE